MKKFRLSSLKKNTMNVIEIDKSLTVLAFFDGAKLKVLHDLCPHMGGPMSQGKYCSKTRQITCPWHGYKYSAEDLTLKENPNEDMWIKPLAGANAAQFKTPAYKMREIPAQIQGDEVVIEA